MREFWRWLYARIGQMFCFTAGTLWILQGASDSTGAKVAAGAALLATALVLRAMMLWRRP